MHKATVLEALDLRKTYPVPRGMFRRPRDLHAVNGVSFTLSPGRTLAIVGESGSGKSTLARQLTLIERPSGGRLLIDGRDAADPAGAERKALRSAVQMVFQNPYGSLNPRRTIGAALAEPLVINTALDAPARRAAVAAMLTKVGLRPEHAERYPHMFSGGQRQRVAIARALMLRPRILVADEPVSALDVSVQAQVLNLLMDLQEEMGLAMVFISHDLGVVRFVADEVLVMYLGLPVEQAGAADLFARPRHPYTRALLASRPSLETIGRRSATPALTGELPSPLNPPSGCVFRTRCPEATARCAAERPLPRPVGGSLVACHFADRDS
ncbi:dipeptide ABC transporter ATP-binding protein [Zavarzinia compransoris]|uniref:Dipeptide ABC transporter ATP-binding protein n=1 Tax=Zavarzinia compransoris TaxID=1264899 RepID=A0A317E540_9PROT|nr:dipeptide ABC transporter ATP-binding protein [Zavarzinia compransoris]PWR22109.1 dipeptide ABC transporter ATP-binding protein [Zavarzinia compransoris]TDP47145.1 dipeptide transport system ATP-binding protein [Zavarzinia compransoris]